MSVISFIEHYQRSIKKNEDDESRLLHCLEKLSNLSIKVSDLEATGIGRTVNSLRKKPGKVGETARGLVTSWMKLVENTGNEDHSGEEKETIESNGYAEMTSGDKEMSSPENCSEKYNNGLGETVKVKEEKSKSRHSHKDKKAVKEEPGTRHSRSDRKGEESKGHESRHSNHHHKRSDSSHKSRSKDHRDSDSRSKSKRSHEETKIKTEPEESDTYDPSDFDGLKIKEERLSPAELCKYDPEVPAKVKKEKESSHKDKREKRKAEESKSKHKGESSSKKPKLETERSSSERKERHDKHSKSSTSKSKSSEKIKKEKIDSPETNPMNGNAGPSFEEALGNLDSAPPLKKSKDKKKSKKDKTSSSSSSKTSSSTKNSNSSLLPRPLPRTEDLASLLDQPALTYKPLPSIPQKSSKSQLSESNMFSFSDVIKNKNQRTKVYSGTKSALTGVPTLLEICQKVLLENIDAIEHVGSAPFEVLEPVFSKANASQLLRIQHHNDHFYEELDDLWRTLVETEFKSATKQEDECWCDVYERSMIERNTKMSELAAKIKANTEARQAPQRKTMLAFEHSLAKPPRTIRKQQIKNGTANGSLPRNVARSTYSEPGPSGLSSSKESTLARTVGLLREGPSTMIKSKKRPAPLMQKTLQLMKSSYRR
ncbi:transcription elongation factor B polypeptide 3 [Cloeon dipterum]|uniref:transcription elongation factor B polypeptide 3 n=1 Tax=Cloeon dipterum TaxID=197152 RepID=UPI00321FCBA4